MTHAHIIDLTAAAMLWVGARGVAGVFAGMSFDDAPRSTRGASR